MRKKWSAKSGGTCRSSVHPHVTFTRSLRVSVPGPQDSAATRACPQSSGQEGRGEGGRKGDEEMEAEKETEEQRRRHKVRQRQGPVGVW
eukprot:1774097-Rhodomonas_salina.2